VRTLETAARFRQGGAIVGAFSGPTDLFILPGYTFQVRGRHDHQLPPAAFYPADAGKRLRRRRKRILATYAAAVQAGYRFYSFGDAMLII